MPNNRFAALRNTAAAANEIKLSYEPILPVEIFGESPDCYNNVGASGYPASHTVFAVFGGMGPVVETKYGPASFPQLTDMETGAQFQVPGHTSLVKHLTDFYRVGEEIALTCFGPPRDDTGKPRKSTKGNAPILWRATLVSELEGRAAQVELTLSAALQEVEFDDIQSLASPEKSARVKK